MLYHTTDTVPCSPTLPPLPQGAGRSPHQVLRPGVTPDVDPGAVAA